MHLYLSVQLVSHLHPWDLACSAACARNTRATRELIALADSSSATYALQLLPVELHVTRGMCARVA
jgi:hypothetical protein